MSSMFWSSQLFRWPPVTKSWSISRELPGCCVRTKMLSWENPFLKHLPEFPVARTRAAARRPGSPGLGHWRGLLAHHVLVHWPSGTGSPLYTQQLSLTCLLPVACLVSALVCVFISQVQPGMWIFERPFVVSPCICQHSLPTVTSSLVSSFTAPPIFVSTVIFAGSKLMFCLPDHGEKSPNSPGLRTELCLNLTMLA